MNGKKIIPIFLIIIAITAGIILTKQPTQGVGMKKLIPVEVSVGKIVSKVSATGEVLPKNRLEVKPSVEGRLEELFVNEGDSVERGQIIGKFSSSERVALIDTARGQGEKELKKWEEFYRPIPIIAPIAGTVISRTVEPGQTVATSDTMITISDILMVTAQVDETDVAKVKKGQLVEVILDAYPDEEVKGEVTHVAYEATTEENVIVYDVDIKLLNTPDFIKSGMSVETIFQTNIKYNVTLINAQDILYDNQGAYLLSAGGRAVDNPKAQSKFYLKTGEQSEGRVEILTKLPRDLKLFTEAVSLEKSNEDQESSNPFLPKRPGRRKKK